MPPLSYQQPSLVVRRHGTGASDAQIRDLQRHLRALGYLWRGIDGAFGGGTEGAVKGLQHDLLHNDGGGNDGQAPVSVLEYNRGRVVDVAGAVDESERHDALADTRPCAELLLKQIEHSTELRIVTFGDMLDDLT